MKSIVEENYDDKFIPETYNRNELETMEDESHQDLAFEEEGDFVIDDDFCDEIILID